MRTYRLLVMVVAVALLCASCDWLQWGGSASHAGFLADGNIGTTNVAALVPSLVTGNAPTGQVVIGNGLVFAERDGVLTAYDVRTYGVVWTAALPAGSTAGGVPAVDLGPASTVFVVVAGASNPVLVGFDVDGVRNCNLLLNRCAPIFRADLGTTNGPATPPVVEDGKVFANGGTRVYAFDASGQTACASSQGTRVCLPLWSASTGFAARGVGPAVASGVVYDAVQFLGVGFLGAFNEQDGSRRWLGTLGAPAVTATPSVAGGTVFVPAGAVIATFAANGCGSTSCARSYALVEKTGDAAASFLATSSVDGPDLFATNGNGMIYAWSKTGCGAATCQPRASLLLNAPGGGSTAYSASAAIENGIVFLLARRVVSAADHVLLLALDERNLTELTRWDLGVGDFGAGLASVSLAGGVVYAPTAAALLAVHPAPVQPLASLAVSPIALSPAFSPSTFDYVLACVAGTNAVTINTTAVPGGSVRLVAPVTTQPSPSQSNQVNLTENQAAIAEATNAQGQSARYWIRCLPHDFPPLDVAFHPASGSPTPGWYLIGDNVLPPGAGAYAMILDTNGTPVWYRHAIVGGASNVTPLGHDIVSFMQNNLAGYGTDPNGQFDVYNLDTRTAQAIRTVGVPTDVHELYTLPNGDHLLLSYPVKHGVDLTGLPGNPAPGPNSTIVDCVVQDVDPQGHLVWQWTGSDHLNPVTEATTLPVPSATLNGETVYDPFHCNSVDASPDGNLLVSARHLNAVFEVRRSDGKINWKLGGTPTNKDGAVIVRIQNDADGGFVQQHDARYMPNGDISLFDDQSPQTNLPARAVEYSLNLTTMVAQPVFSFAAPTAVPSCCMGSFRRYSDGHDVIGWGLLNPRGGLVLTELDASGNDVLDIGFVGGGSSYRSVKVPPPRFDINVLRRTAGL